MNKIRVKPLANKSFVLEIRESEEPVKNYYLTRCDLMRFCVHALLAVEPSTVEGLKILYGSSKGTFSNAWFIRCCIRAAREPWSDIPEEI